MAPKLSSNVPYLSQHFYYPFDNLQYKFSIYLSLDYSLYIHVHTKLAEIVSNPPPHSDIWYRAMLGLDCREQDTDSKVAIDQRALPL